AGADVVSGGELRACLESGFARDRIVFSGVGKTDDEIRFAVDSGPCAINAESGRGSEKGGAMAGAIGDSVNVALRVNPDIDARSHPYISTGRRHNKFGVEIGGGRKICRRFRAHPPARMAGLPAPKGSQILAPEPLAESAKGLAALAVELA